MIDLSIIIVNWNSKEYLRRCIFSILEQTSTLDFEIIVIDAASFDGCAEMLREFYPRVRFLQMEQNLGFARANNAAYVESRGSSLLFLNPDTEVVGPAVQVMHRGLRTLDNPGVIGCKLLNTDGSLQTTCIQAFPTLVNQVLNARLLRQLFPRFKLWGMAPLFTNVATPAKVDVVSGACLLVDRSVFEALGRFSTDYFMYSEDVDLCFKARERALINYYLPSAQVVHHGGGSTAEVEINAFSSVMMLESRVRFFRKTRSRAYGSLFRAAMFPVSLIRLAAVIICWPIGHLTVGGARWQSVFQKWKARLRWTLGAEDWSSQY